MTDVGIRKLRQEASELLRRVQEGETIQITDRGRPVALLAPIPKGSPLEQLRASGQVDEASATLDDLPPPLALSPDAELPSGTLARLRRDER